MVRLCSMWESRSRLSRISFHSAIWLTHRRDTRPGNLEPVDQLRILTLDEPGVVLAGVLAGLGDVVAKRSIISRRTRSLQSSCSSPAALDLGVQVVALQVSDLQQPGLVVDAGDLPAALVDVLGHAHVAQQLRAQPCTSGTGRRSSCGCSAAYSRSAWPWGWCS